MSQITMSSPLCFTTIIMGINIICFTNLFNLISYGKVVSWQRL